MKLAVLTSSLLLLLTLVTSADASANSKKESKKTTHMESLRLKLKNYKGSTRI